MRYISGGMKCVDSPLVMIKTVFYVKDKPNSNSIISDGYKYTDM